VSQRTSPSNPEFELHRRRLKRRRRLESRYGIVLIVSGFVYFIFVPISLVPLLFLHGRWGVAGITGVTGAAICLYFVFNGVASIRASRRPVTSREVRQQRSKARRELFQLAQGELPPDYTLKGRFIILLKGSIVTITGTLMLFFFLIGIPELVWTRILLGIVAMLVELMLILDVLYVRAKIARNLPAQSARELSLLLASGEMTAGDTHPEGD
jgi:hypothetical protein